MFLLLLFPLPFRAVLGVSRRDRRPSRGRPDGLRGPVRRIGHGELVKFEFLCVDSTTMNSTAPPGHCHCHRVPWTHSSRRYRVHRVQCGPVDATADSPSRPQSPPSTTAYRQLVASAAGPSFEAVAKVVSGLSLGDLIDSMGADEVVVRVAFAGVNGGCETFRCRAEHAFARNKTLTDFSLGAEGVGTVVAVGHSAEDDTDKGSGVVVGSPVMFVGGAFSEFVKVKRASVTPVPVASAEYAVGAHRNIRSQEPERVLTPLHNTRSHDRQALRISGHVAYSALTYKVELNRGDVVLVTAGAGATGSFAVQVAKRRGCHVLATCRNAAKAEVLRGLGADRVIDYSVESVREVFEREYKGRVDVCYEGVGGAMLEDVWQVALKDDGKVLSVGYISQYPHNEVPVSAAAGRSNEALDLPPSQDVFWKAMTLERGGKTLIGNVWPDDAGDRQRALEEVVALVAAGELTCVVDSRRFVGVESAADAVSYMLSGSAIGKVVVEM